MSPTVENEALRVVLPTHVLERARFLNACPTRSDGAFVLYWMHHAVRDHENPALDAALALGQGLGRPVLVYQGLGGRHAYNSDRHHRFIIEGAREAHAALQAHGISAVFHLPVSVDGTSPLSGLLARASVAVFEDYPAPPFPQWSERLAAQTDTPVIAVDAACIVPLQTHGRCFQRAFEFRRATESEYEQRVALDWPAAIASPGPYDGPLGFEPVDLAGLDIDAVCAAAPIDHTVPPVPATPGGSTPGYTRWQGFRDNGLPGYARDRNDAAIQWPRGVSRLSPYLHHGQVSPWRVAREAWQLGGPGADKFLDELLIWRELAYQFCHHTRNPESLGALPRWARETLEAHRADARPQLVDPETLAASGSPDALWNLAQDSLRLHGELHNNLRMTWAKAIPFWRPDPVSTLQTLLDLNHRYALDGSDPNSYGGLLWALGLFDRPFEEQAVIGRLRPRSSRAHAKRLDVDSFRRRVRRPPTGEPQRIAVVGAGIAGLAAARALHDQGHHVQVFEKSRGPGGRAATRRLDEVGFDHGAQYFSVRDPRFRRVVDAWVEAGWAARWPGRAAHFRGGELVPDKEGRLGYVGTPGMSAVGKALASNLSVRCGTRVEALDRDSGGWSLRSDTGETLGRYDAVVVAVPAPQAVPLLGQIAPEIADRAAAIEYAPAWAAMLALDSRIDVDADGVFFEGPVLGWAARNASKPQRTGESWVLHAAPDWSRTHLELAPEGVIDRLLGELTTTLRIAAPSVRQASAHRWLYALVDNPLSDEALWSSSHRLAVCGDWCAGARIEAAFLSGQAAAGYLLRDLVSGWHPDED